MTTTLERDRDENALLAGNEYKVVIIGPLGAGKTSLMLRYIYDTFEDKISRFVSEEKKSINVDGKEVVLDIWDTAGQERFQSITNRFYSDTHAVIIVYDITSVEASSDLEFWIREVQYYLTQELENGMPVIIVGNKKDLVESNDSGGGGGGNGGTGMFAVDFRQIQEVANSNGFMRPLEISAKTGLNVKRIFHALATELVKRKGGHKMPSVHSSSKKDCACSGSS